MKPFYKAPLATVYHLETVRRVRFDPFWGLRATWCASAPRRKVSSTPEGYYPLTPSVLQQQLHKIIFSAMCPPLTQVMVEGKSGECVTVTSAVYNSVINV